MPPAFEARRYKLFTNCRTFPSKFGRPMGRLLLPNIPNYSETGSSTFWYLYALFLLTLPLKLAFPNLLSLSVQMGGIFVETDKGFKS